MRFGCYLVATAGFRMPLLAVGAQGSAGAHFPSSWTFPAKLLRKSVRVYVQVEQLSSSDGGGSINRPCGDEA